MSILLCFFILLLGYLVFGISFYFLKRREELKTIKINCLPVVAMMILCGITFLGRMLIPYLSPTLSLWITIPDQLKNVDKVATIQFSFDFLFLMILILIGYIDYKKQIIPNILNGLIIVLGVLMLICDIILPFIVSKMFAGQSISKEVITETTSFPEHIIGLFILSIPLVIIGIFYKGSFGMGDVKLLASAGFFMGWKDIVMGTFLGSFIAATICIISLIRHKMELKDKIAFGPYLCMGMAIVRLINWFMI